MTREETVKRIVERISWLVKMDTEVNGKSAAHERMLRAIELDLCIEQNEEEFRKITQATQRSEADFVSCMLGYAYYLGHMTSKEMISAT